MKASREIQSAENRVAHAKRNVQMANDALKNAENALRDIYARTRVAHSAHESDTRLTYDACDAKPATH